MQKSDIIEIVAEKSGYAFRAILSGVGTRDLKNVRRYAMYFLNRKLGMNHRQIGEYLDTSSSTISISIARVEAEMIKGDLNTGVFREILNEINR